MSLRLVARTLAGSLLEPFAATSSASRSAVRRVSTACRLATDGADQLADPDQLSSTYSSADGFSNEILDTVRAEQCLNSVQLMGRCYAEPKLMGTEERRIFCFYLVTAAQGSQMCQFHRIVWFPRSEGRQEELRVGTGDRVHVTGSLNYYKFLPAFETKRQKVSQIIARSIINLSRDAHVGQLTAEEDIDVKSEAGVAED